MKQHSLKPFIVGALAAVVMTAITSPAVGLAQSATASLKKAIQEVVVANDSSQPVPVQMQGTPNVNVVNAPAVTAVQKTMFTSFPSGNRFTDRVVLYTVPAGKRLIIESVSIASNLAGPDQRLMHVLFEADNGDVVPFVISVQPVAEGVFASTGANVFRATREVTAYAAAGTEVVARGTRDGTDLDHLDSLMVAFAGRLVDAP